MFLKIWPPVGHGVDHREHLLCTIKYRRIRINPCFRIVKSNFCEFIFSWGKVWQQLTEFVNPPPPHPPSPTLLPSNKGFRREIRIFWYLYWITRSLLAWLRSMLLDIYKRKRERSVLQQSKRKKLFIIKYYQTYWLHWNTLATEIYNNAFI